MADNYDSTSDTYDSTPCDLRTSGNKYPTETLWSCVTGTKDECVITPDEEAIHEIEFRSVRRHGFEGELVINSSRNCIQYINTDSDTEVLEQGTKIKKQVTLEEQASKFSEKYLIELCSNHSTEEYLETSCIRKAQTNDEGSSEVVSDGGNQDAFESIELTPKLTIRS